MADAMKLSPDANEIVKTLNEMEDLNKGEKLIMFCTLVDVNAIMKELSMKAMMIKCDMSTNNLCTGFTYAMLKLARPELFTEERNDEKEKS